MTAAIRQRQGALESTNATVALRRHAHLDLEPFDEPLRAEPDDTSNSRNARRQRRSIERGQRKGDGRMQARWSPQLSKRSFERMELRIDVAALQKAFTERGSTRAAPDCREWYVGIA